MTIKEIQALGISRSTISNWENEDNEKHPLYVLLRNLSSSQAQELLKKHPTHRLSQLLNKNTSLEQRFSYEEIVNTFKKSNYLNLSKREKIIINRFFQECDYSDYKTLQDVYKIPRGNVKKLYVSSHELRTLRGVAKTWDRSFRLSHIEQRVIGKRNDSRLFPELFDVLKEKGIKRV